ncbi:MAG: helix-turn-helix transcriptional regulator [Acholeplasmatales bacterium]|nr:helix-turn-helix transcriptional regulator [Acholeplasmatales bacterium]
MAKGTKIGESLILLRKSKKLSRNQFSRLFNTHVSEVTRWENNSVALDDKTIEKIAKFYDLTYDELVSGSFKEKLIKEENNDKSEENEEKIIEEENNDNNKFKKLFIFEKSLCITTLVLEIVVFLLLCILGYTTEKPLPTALVIYGSAAIIYYSYRIIIEFTHKGKINNDSQKLLELMKLNHSFNNHIVALFAFNLIMASMFFLEPIVYENDIMDIKWFITFSIIVFVTLFALDIHTFAYFYYDNNLDYPKGYKKLLYVVKHSFNMKTLFFLMSILIMVSNFIVPIFNKGSIDYRLYDFQNNYGNGMFYFCMILIIFAILLCITLIIKKKIILVPYLILLAGLIFNIISLKLAFDDLSKTTTITYSTGYNMLLIELVVLIVLNVIEIYFDLFTIQKRKLEK